jgi:hypothetical protein
LHHGERRDGQHPPLIASGRWTAIQDSLTRLEPDVARRRDSDRPARREFLLRGVAFCGKCGSTLYGVERAAEWMYLCREVRECTGVCDAQPIPADTLEANSLGHPRDFFFDFLAFARERIAEREGERDRLAQSLAEHEERITRLNIRREKAHAGWLRYVEPDRLDFADHAMEALASVDQEIADRKLTLGDLRTRAQEWSAPVSADGLLAFYSEVRDVIAGRLATSQSTIELHGALHGFLEGVWVKVELDGRGLHCEYVLRDSLAVMCGEVEKEIEVRSWLMEHRRKRDADPKPSGALQTSPPRPA